MISRVLQVLFKPSTVTISVEPEKPRAGKKAVLTCTSASSNPTAEITWRHKGKEMKATDISVTKGDFGGNVTASMLEIDVTPDHEGAVLSVKQRIPD